MPVPAEAGSNWSPLTPGPEYVPPVGVAESVNIASLVQTEAVKGGKLMTGYAFTVIVTFVDETVVGDAQVALEVISTCTTSPFANAELVYVLPVSPAKAVPLRYH